MFVVYLKYRVLNIITQLFAIMQFASHKTSRDFKATVNEEVDEEK